jgi:hypothetical protein
MHELLLDVADPRDVFLIADAAKCARDDFPSSSQVILLSDEALSGLGLPHEGFNAAWQCGDYGYYLLAQHTAFQFAWLVEPDVYFARDAHEFFAVAARSSADLLAADVVRASSTWYWFKAAQSLGYGEVWNAFFPLTRLSRSAVDHLLRLRRALVAPVPGARTGTFPNDEAFVATTLKAGGFACESMSTMFPGEFTHFQFRDRYLLPDVIDAIPGPKVLHSALDPPDFEKFVSGRLASLALTQERFIDSAANSLASCSPEARAQYLQLLLDAIGEEIARRVDATSLSSRSVP